MTQPLSPASADLPELVERLDKLASDMNRGDRNEVWVSCSDHLLVRAAADALRRHAQCAPREPTEAMLNAARDWSRAKYGKPIGSEAATGCWQIMFDASSVTSTEAPAQRQQEPVAWLDTRTAELGWENRIVATNPQYVENNGPENFAALYAFPSTLRDSPVMGAAKRAAKVVDGWSDAKRDYADRVTSTLCSCKASGRDGQHMAWCPALSRPNSGGA